jgi:ABC-type phosphate transport system substrate-binding protein
MRRNSRISAAVAVASVAGLAAIAPGAQASYFQAPQSNGVCQGVDNLHGIGASGLRGAQVAWGNTLGAPSPGAPLAQGFGYDGGADYPACAVFKTAADGGSKVFDYRATGSGSCTTILGAGAANQPRQYFDGTTTLNDVGYCGTEDAPTEAQIGFAEEGPTTASTHPAEAQLLTIPVAQVAAAINVRLPDGCQVGDSSKRQISRDAAEGAFEGTATTWGAIFGTDMTASGASPTSAECRAKAFKRVVRLDSSGTTFLLKRYLQGVTDLPGGSSFDWREPSFGGTLANTAWPNDTGATAVLRGDANGNGSLLDKLSLQTANGGIGYADLATARSKSYGWDFTGGTYVATDRNLWLRVQRIANDTYNSPAISNAQVTSGTNLGSACVNVTYSNTPSTNLGASWAPATAVPTPTDYPVCGLNYMVTSLWGFDTEANRFTKVWAGSTAGEFRATKDYLRYVTGLIRPGVGPGLLPSNGYAKLPPDVLATAQCAVKQIGWLRASSDPQPESSISRDPLGTDPLC